MGSGRRRRRSMRSALAESEDLLGAQAPRVELVPEGVDHPDADAVVEFAEACGIVLDPWQEYVLRRSLLRDGGRWAAFSVGLCVPRQNGKNGILEVRELAGPLVLGERLLVHSAHLADTSKEAFRRLDEILEANEWLSREVRHIWRTNGHEAIEFRGGARIRFRTRTKGGGRGFSGDFIAFDEAMILSETSLGSILPVVSAQPDPQIWYTGSAVDQSIHEDGVVFGRLRSRALAGKEPRLAYFEWSVEAESPSHVEDAVLTDPAAWAAANPALGIRIDPEYVAGERRELSARTFAVERLGVGDWPDPDGAASSVIPVEAWKALEDPKSVMVDPVCFAYDVSPDRSSSSICAAGVRADGLPHVEVVDRRAGTGWLPERLAELNETHKPSAVLCDGVGPAKSLLPELSALGVTVQTLAAGDHAAACGLIFDLVEQAKLRHLGQRELTAALRGAATRPLGDAWAWARKRSSADISPLVAGTIALWGVQTTQLSDVWIG